MKWWLSRGSIKVNHRLLVSVRVLISVGVLVLAIGLKDHLLCLDFDAFVDDAGSLFQRSYGDMLLLLLMVRLLIRS